MSVATLRISFDGGSLVFEGLDEANTLGLPGVRFDPRTGQHRAEGSWYRTIILHLQKAKIPFVDGAREYKLTPWPILVEKPAFPHQTEGLAAWIAADKQGVVVLPTGTGKTHLANLAINAAERPSLVVTPTIDLMNQWYDELTLCFQADVGLVGGGYSEIKPLTVTTYDSAYQNVDRLGNKFGLLIFDECHHLPGPTYGLAARGSIAPFRLGLTATPERADNAHEHLDQLIGPDRLSPRDHPVAGGIPGRLHDRDPLRQPQPRRAEPLRIVAADLPRVPRLDRHRHATSRRLGPVPLRGPPLGRGPPGLSRLPRPALPSPSPPPPSSRSSKTSWSDITATA